MPILQLEWDAHSFVMKGHPYFFVRARDPHCYKGEVPTPF